MSTEIKTTMKDHDIVEFWGGSDKGVCLQVTAKELKIADTATAQIQEAGFVKLTMEESAALVNSLLSFIKKEARRRQGLLKKEITNLKITEKTVFTEISDLNMKSFEVGEVAVGLVSKFCPKWEYGGKSKTKTDKGES
jgi:hypothetical protein